MKHTLAIQLEDHPGALARVTQLFARRGYNIESLAVGPSERPDVSRLTLRVDCSEHALEQIVKQMHKLVNVLRVTELAVDEGVERELVLITVAAPPERRSELLALGDVFGARVAELRPRLDRLRARRSVRADRIVRRARSPARNPRARPYRARRPSQAPARRHGARPGRPPHNDKEYLTWQQKSSPTATSSF